MNSSTSQKIVASYASSRPAESPPSIPIRAGSKDFLLVSGGIRSTVQGRSSVEPSELLSSTTTRLSTPTSRE